MLPATTEEEIESVAISEHVVCKVSRDIMVHDLWLSTVIHSWIWGQIWGQV